MLSPLFIESEQAIRAVDTAVNGGHRVVALFGQKPVRSRRNPNLMNDGAEEEAEIQAEDLYQVGTAVQVVRMQRTPDNKLQVLVNGIARVGLEALVQTAPYPLARVRVLDGWAEKTNELEALSQNVMDLFKKAMDLVPNVPKELMAALDSLSEPEKKADFIASQFNLRFEERQEVLSELNLRLRFELIHKGSDTGSLKSWNCGRRSRAMPPVRWTKRSANTSSASNSRRFAKNWAKERTRPKRSRSCGRKSKRPGMTGEARKGRRSRAVTDGENAGGNRAEYTVSRTYLDWLVELPWSKSSEDRIDVDRAQKILDDDHYGIEKPKDRILEYLAVRRLKTTCGVRFCAWWVRRAQGRPRWAVPWPEPWTALLSGYRWAASGMNRRSGATGGPTWARCRVGSSRGCGGRVRTIPVFMLDEIDKLGADFRGDPSAALLEVLDPEQNCRFEDHYLDVPFDLSQVMFIATANTLHTIPPALLDRMEVLELPGLYRAGKAANRPHLPGAQAA